MDKTIDVTALGEVLIDFTFAGNGGDGKKLYEENPGGAPGNCACAVAKLGGNSAFIGMVGEDSFGEDIKKALKNVNYSGITLPKNVILSAPAKDYINREKINITYI